MKARYYLIDGHSVIFAWPSLRTLHARRNALARNELVTILTRFGDASGVRIVVVFDGQGERPDADVTAPEGVQIFYSASGQTADQVIERLVAKYGSIHDLTVVSDDNLVRQTSATFGACSISTGQLQLEIEAADRDFAARLKAHNHRGNSFRW